MRLTRSRWYRLLIWSPVIITLLLAAIITRQYIATPRVTRVLILCMDGVNGNLMTRGLHSDAMFIAEINRATRHLALRQIPRDTMTGVSPRLGLEKVNMSLSEAGPAETCRTVGRLAGCKIDHYVIMTVPDFLALVDAMGGVRAKIPVKSRTGSELDAMQGHEVTLNSIAALLLVQKRLDSDELRRGRQSALVSEFVRDRMSVAPYRLPGLALWAWRLDTDMSLVQCAAYARAAAHSSITTKTMPTTAIYLNGRSYVMPSTQPNSD